MRLLPTGGTTETLIRKHKSGTRSYAIFSQEEATERGIVFKPWREATVNCWALTDDGYVVQCLGKTLFTSKRGRTIDLLSFSIGKVWVTSKASLRWIPRREKHAYGTGEKTWVEREAGKTRTKNLVREYARQKLAVAAGVQSAIDYKAVGLAYRQDQKIPEAQAKQLLKQEIIKDMVAEETRRLCEEMGVTDQYVIEKVKKAIELAEASMDAGNIIRGAEFFKKLRDMDPKPANLLPPAADEDFLTRLIETKEST